MKTILALALLGLLTTACGDHPVGAKAGEECYDGVERTASCSADLRCCVPVCDADLGACGPDPLAYCTPAGQIAGLYCLGQ